MSAMRSASSMMRMPICVEVELAPLEQVDQAARRRDRDLDLAREVADLAVHRRAAVERGDAHADLLADRAQHVDDLLGELAGRHEHERGRMSGLRGLRRSGATADRRRASCPSRSWPCRTRRARRGRRRWSRPGRGRVRRCPAPRGRRRSRPGGRALRMWSRFSSTCTSYRRPILGISERETGEGRPRAPADGRNPKHQNSWSEHPTGTSGRSGSPGRTHSR